MIATLKDKAEIETAIAKLKHIICFAETEKIRAIAAGKIINAVIKNTPTMRTDKAIASESKIKKVKFQNSVFTPSI